MDLVLDIAVSALSVGVVGLYSWSLRGHFASEKMPPGALLISGVVTVTAMLFLFLTWTLPQPAWAQVAGLTLEVAATALFFAAIKASRQARLRFAFDDVHPHSLVTEGPYGYVRHPFYVSYILFWIGWALAVSSLWAVLPVLILVALYIVAARTEEKNFARTPLAVDYAAYAARVGFFWPRLNF